eukprot:CAMPEP_0116836904 /NCGR_PEP_ID=MMETSP0418-20121206/8360_1 /TAXON_ID=1158023 /ORGANISM="Astrosyne radiata, Strain 13vi08-1A" /LENGTH=258 /DNA_ID=CAMNT_0004466735 /DNA_START=69 /DNA_END=845 /DNA_ORIENTATION=+
MVRVKSLLMCVRTQRFSVLHAGPVPHNNRVSGKQICLSELEKRVAQLERIRFACPDHVAEVDESMRRARYDVEVVKRIYSVVWKWVPPGYYEASLQERARLLGVSSTQFLCKSLLMENKNGTGAKDHPRFVLVVIPYVCTLDSRKLANAIRSLRPNPKDRLDYSEFDIRVASAEDNDTLTGFSHNSVTPFGLLDPTLQIVLSDSVVDLKFFFMGGGHVSLKLGMAVSDFVKATSAIVANITQPRVSEAEDDFGMADGK